MQEINVLAPKKTLLSEQNGNNNPSTTDVLSPTATQTPTETDDSSTLNFKFPELKWRIFDEWMKIISFFDKFSYTGTTNQPNLCLTFM